MTVKVWADGTLEGMVAWLSNEYFDMSVFDVK